MRNNVCLIVPDAYNPEKINPKNITENYYPLENLGIGILLACLKQSNIAADVWDMTIDDLNMESLVDKIVSADYQILGITCHQYSYPCVLELIFSLEKIQYQGIIILGGQLPTIAPELLSQQCERINYILMGEADYSFPLLVKRLLNKHAIDDIPGLAQIKDGKLLISGSPVKIHDLNILPFPIHYGLDKQTNKKIIPALSGSRGCPFGYCTYCSTAVYYRKIYHKNLWRCRNPENIITELKNIITLYNTNYFVFADETVLDGSDFSKKRMLEFARLINKNNLKISFMFDCRADYIDEYLFDKLKNAGLTSIFVGFETNNINYLNKIRKGIKPGQNERAVAILKNLDIKIIPGFIPFYPDASLESIKKDFSFLVNIINYNGVHKYVKRLLPEYNTPFYNQLKRDKNLLGEFPFHYYNFKDHRVQRLYDYLQDLIFEKAVDDPELLYDKVKTFI